MDRAGTDDLLASPLAKRNVLLAVIPASSLLEMCFFTAPDWINSFRRGFRNSFADDCRRGRLQAL